MNYIVIGYARRTEQFINSFEDMRSALKFIYEKFRLLNIEKSLTNFNLCPTYARFSKTLHLKRVFFINEVPDFICMLKKTCKGDINVELAKDIVKELLSSGLSN